MSTDKKMRGEKSANDGRESLEKFSVKRYSRGEQYVGTVKNGMKHGVGLMVYDRHYAYLGEWENNRYHGWGILITSHTCYHIGHFRKGAASGPGLCRKPDGQYVGDWREGKPLGVGENITPLQTMLGEYHAGQLQGFCHITNRTPPTTHAGWFINDEPAGVSVLTAAPLMFIGSLTIYGKQGPGALLINDDLIFKGKFHRNRPKGICMMCEGTSIYEGHLYFGDRHDTGRETRGAREEYVGQWAHDMREGRGREKKNGDEYVGEWKQGYRHGIGLEKRRDGSVYYGEWAWGKRQGFGYENVDGREYQGYFKDNLHEGQAILRLPNTKPALATFTRGTLEGFSRDPPPATIPEMPLPALTPFLNTVSKTVEGIEHAIAQESDFDYSNAAKKIIEKEKELRVKISGIKTDLVDGVRWVKKVWRRVERGVNKWRMGGMEEFVNIRWSIEPRFSKDVEEKMYADRTSSHGIYTLLDRKNFLNPPIDEMNPDIEGEAVQPLITRGVSHLLPNPEKSKLLTPLLTKLTPYREQGLGTAFPVFQPRPPPPITAKLYDDIYLWRPEQQGLIEERVLGVEDETPPGDDELDFASNDEAAFNPLEATHLQTEGEPDHGFDTRVSAVEGLPTSSDKSANLPKGNINNKAGGVKWDDVSLHLVKEPHSAHHNQFGSEFIDIKDGDYLGRLQNTPGDLRTPLSNINQPDNSNMKNPPKPSTDTKQPGIMFIQDNPSKENAPAPADDKEFETISEFSAARQRDTTTKEPPLTVKVKNQRTYASILDNLDVPTMKSPPVDLPGGNRASSTAQTDDLGGKVFWRAGGKWGKYPPSQY